MSRLVLKFGGTSVADVAHIRRAAAHVAREQQAGHACAVVVSAMAGVTNQLVSYVHDMRPLPAMRDYDVVVSTGEQVTSGLMALALQSLGLKAQALQGWQLPLVTDAAHGAASIVSVGHDKLIALMEQGIIPVIAGFQGVSPSLEITTLGRGGSDTSAVAIASAIGAERCDIYTDVDGIYTTDPRIVPQARRMSKIAYEEMLEMASLGAKVLHVRSVELAMVAGVPVLVRSSFADAASSDIVGTLVCDEERHMENQAVSGIAYSAHEAKLSLIGLADTPRMAGDIFTPLAEAAVNVDMIVQNVSADNKTIDLTFTVPAADYARSMALVEGLRGKINYRELRGDPHIAKVSVIGAGMRNHSGVAAAMFSALGQQDINIQAITTSEIKISILIDKKQTELAVKTLHSLYGLDRA